MSYTGCWTAIATDCNLNQVNTVAFGTLQPVGKNLPHTNVPQYLALSACRKIKNNFVLIESQDTVNKQINTKVADISSSVLNLNQSIESNNESLTYQLSSLKVELYKELSEKIKENQDLISKLIKDTEEKFVLFGKKFDVLDETNKNLSSELKLELGDSHQKLDEQRTIQFFEEQRNLLIIMSSVFCLIFSLAASILIGLILKKLYKKKEINKFVNTNVPNSPMNTEIGRFKNSAEN